MKRTYIKPTLREVVIETNHLMAASISVCSDQTEGTNGWGEAQSKGFDEDWDFDEEE